jgi:hypothetical protein
MEHPGDDDLDRIKAERDRQAVAKYQAWFLTTLFDISFSRALAIVQRHGTNRSILIQATSRELGVEPLSHRRSKRVAVWRCSMAFRDVTNPEDVSMLTTMLEQHCDKYGTGSDEARQSVASSLLRHYRHGIVDASELARLIEREDRGAS